MERDLGNIVAGKCANLTVLARASFLCRNVMRAVVELGDPLRARIERGSDDHTGDGDISDVDGSLQSVRSHAVHMADRA